MYGAQVVLEVLVSMNRDRLGLFSSLGLSELLSRRNVLNPAKSCASRQRVILSGRNFQLMGPLPPPPPPPPPLKVNWCSERIHDADHVSDHRRVKSPEIRA